MTKFEQVGINHLMDSNCKEEANKTFKLSCDLCCNRGMHINCDRCAIAFNHSMIIAFFEESAKTY